MTTPTLPPPQVQLDWIPLPAPNWFIARSRGRYMIKEGQGAEILRGAWIESGVMTKFMDAFLERQAAPQPPATATTEALAQFIRTVDGNHTMGAAGLAEAIVGWLSADPMARAELVGEPVPGVVWMKDGASLVGDEQHWCKNRGARRLYLQADRPDVPEDVAAAVLAALINAEPVTGNDGAQVGVSLKLSAIDAQALRDAMLALTEGGN